MLAERSLTPAEKEKKEEIVLALKRDNPDMPKDQMYAIATAKAKKVAESNMTEKKKLLLSDDEMSEDGNDFTVKLARKIVANPNKNFVDVDGKKVRVKMPLSTARQIVKDVETTRSEDQGDFNFKAKITKKGDTFEIGGDTFVREQIESSHRYSYIVEKALKLNEQFKVNDDTIDHEDYNYDHVTSLNWKTRQISAKNNYELLTNLNNYSFTETDYGPGILGKDFSSLGPNGRPFPVVVSKEMFRALGKIDGQGNWAPVFSIPPKDKTNNYGQFGKGKSVAFKFTRPRKDVSTAATRLTLNLLENGFTKIKWADQFRSTGDFFILAELGSGFGAALFIDATRKTMDRGYEFSPIFNLHKKKLNGKHLIFNKSDVYSSRGTGDDYSVGSRRVVPFLTSTLGSFDPYAQPPAFKDFDIYKDMTFEGGPGSVGEGDSITPATVIKLSVGKNILSDPRQYNIVSGASIQGRPLTIYDLIQKQDASTLPERSRSETKTDEKKYMDLGLADEGLFSSTPAPASVPASTPTVTPTPTQEPTVYRSEPQEREQEQKTQEALITTAVSAYLLRQWRNIKSMFETKVDTTSKNALERALQLLKDAVNPKSDLGQKIYSEDNVPVAVLLGVGAGGYFGARRLFRGRRERQLYRSMRSDYGSKRELEMIARRSGLDRVPDEQLVAMLRSLERYESTNPQVRRLYDL